MKRSPILCLHYHLIFVTYLEPTLSTLSVRSPKSPTVLGSTTTAEAPQTEYSSTSISSSATISCREMDATSAASETTNYSVTDYNSSFSHTNIQTDATLSTN